MFVRSLSPSHSPSKTPAFSVIAAEQWNIEENHISRQNGYCHKFTLNTLNQVGVPDKRKGQTNQNVRVWSEERFIARTEQGGWGGSCPRGLNSLMVFKEEFL